MTADPAPIVVLGATGAQGRPVVDQLLAAGRPVRAVGHTPQKLEALAAAGAEAHPLDLADRAALDRAFAGAAGAFVHLPFVPVEALYRAWAEAIGAALVAAQVPLAVVSSSGPVPEDAAGVATFDSKRVADAAFRASGAPLVHLRPAIYLGNLAAPFSAPSVVAAGELRYPPFASDVPMPYVSVEEQAALAIAALDRPDLAGRTFALGEQLTGARLADALGAVLGRPVLHRPMTPEELGDGVRPMLGDQVADVLTADYALFGTEREALGLTADTDAVHDELGVPRTPLDVWMRSVDWEAAAAFAAAPAG